MTASTRGPYRDNAEDFAHLDKVKIKLLLCWVDEDGDDFHTRGEIELSRDDNLFEILNRRAAFRSWRRLTVMPDRYQLYRYHGDAWFQGDPVYIRRGVEQAVQRFQDDLHEFPPQVPPIFILEVD